MGGNYDMLCFVCILSTNQHSVNSISGRDQCLWVRQNGGWWKQHWDLALKCASVQTHLHLGRSDFKMQTKTSGGTSQESLASLSQCLVPSPLPSHTAWQTAHVPHRLTYQPEPLPSRLSWLGDLVLFLCFVCLLVWDWVKVFPLLTGKFDVKKSLQMWKTKKSKSVIIGNSGSAL